MDYRTILVHADPSLHAPARIALAASLARQANAHLVGAATTGVSRHVCPEGYVSVPGKIISGYLDPLIAAAQRDLDHFEALALASGAVLLERKLVCDHTDDGLARQATFADLVVLSQNDPGESTSNFVSALPEYVVYNCARPVLVVPHSRQLPHVGRNVLLAWNASREATAAMTGAIALMQRASEVTVVRFDPAPDSDTEGMTPATDLPRYLERHGIGAQFVDRDSGGDVGKALLALAGELGCDLIVMGCYGHTRMHELLLGGASRTVLQRMHVPVLMAH